MTDRPKIPGGTMTFLEQNALKMPIMCITCTRTSEAYFELNNEGNPSSVTAKCPKCSNTTYALSMFGIDQMTIALVKEVARLRNDVFDLHCAAEEAQERSVVPRPDGKE